MNLNPSHQTPLKVTNQVIKGLEEEKQQLLPALVKQPLKTNHASMQKNHNNHQSVKKSDRNKTKSEATTTHRPQLSFFTAALLCLDTLAFQPFQRRLMTVS